MQVSTGITMLFRIFYFNAIFAITKGSGRGNVAIARLLSQSVNGSIVFTETSTGLHVTGTITGLKAGRYGFHVHQLGDITTCDASGGHFNPNDNNHGGRDHQVRHVGDLGNVVFVGTDNAVANVDFVDSVISLRGRNNILGRTLVLHGQEDDLGLGGDWASLSTGNAGPRVACGVIGIKSPADTWNSATSVSSSLLLFILAVGIVCLIF